jgi:hypothetical protein
MWRRGFRTFVHLRAPDPTNSLVRNPPFKLTYSVVSSLDEYFEDADGEFVSAARDEEVRALVNDLQCPDG